MSAAISWCPRSSARRGSRPPTRRSTGSSPRTRRQVTRSASTSSSSRPASCPPRTRRSPNRARSRSPRSSTAPDHLELILHHIQVALNIPPNTHRPGGPHIDGHVRQHPDQAAPDSFTLLAGIFLSDETEADSGALWVWPGSHLVHEALFRERGADALMETGGHITMLRDPPPLGPSERVVGRRGDLLLAHFLLGHNTGPNLTTTDTTDALLPTRLPDASKPRVDDLPRRAHGVRAGAAGNDGVMSGTVEPVPARLHTITTRLVFAHQAAEAIEFYGKAFGAEPIADSFVDPDGNVVHAEIRIGDSVVFVTDEGEENGSAPSSVGGKVTAVMAHQRARRRRGVEPGDRGRVRGDLRAQRPLLRRPRWARPRPVRSSMDDQHPHRRRRRRRDATADAAVHGRARLSRRLSGGDDGTRTHDPLLAKQVLFQLSYVPLRGHHRRRRVGRGRSGGVTLRR